MPPAASSRMKPVACVLAPISVGASIDRARLGAHVQRDPRALRARSEGRAMTVSNTLPEPRRHPAQPPVHPRPPKLSTERSGFNDRVANGIAKTVGTMWMFYASIIGF